MPAASSYDLSPLSGYGWNADDLNPFPDEAALSGVEAVVTNHGYATDVALPAVVPEFYIYLKVRSLRGVSTIIERICSSEMPRLRMKGRILA